MSLINDVLRDLQSRDKAHVAVTQLEAVRKESQWRAWSRFAAVFVLGLSLASALFYFAGSDKATVAKDTQPGLALRRDPGTMSGHASASVQSRGVAVGATAGKNPPTAESGHVPASKTEPVEPRFAAKDDGEPATAVNQTKTLSVRAQESARSPAPPLLVAEQARVAPPGQPREHLRSRRIHKVLDSPQLRARRILTQAQQFVRRGRLRQALPLLTQAAQLTPADESIYRLRAGVLQRLNQPGAADKVLLQGLEAIPGSSTLLQARARLHLTAGDLEGAIRLLRASPRSLEASPAIAALLAGLLQRAHRFPEALKIYRKLVDGDQVRPSWWLGFAISLEQTGSAERALAAYQSALAAGLDGPSQAYARGRLAALAATHQHE